MASKKPGKTPAAKNPGAAEAKSLPALLRSVLGSPQSEQVIKHQMLDLARKNLHIPEVVAVLLESLPKTRDKETRDALLGLIGSIETSRFASLEALHDAFLEVFRNEKERSVRTALMARLREGIHQDERLAGFFLGILAEPVLNDEERRAAVAAVAGLASVTEKTAITALESCRNGDASIQETAVALAERCPTWGEGLVAALQPYLDIKRDRSLRLRVLNRLAGAKALTPAYLPLLRQTLRNDPDEGARGAALETLRSIKPWDGGVLELLLWTAAQDASAGLRSRAVALQAEGPELSDAQVAALARQLGSDRSAGVRVGILTVLKNHARVAEVRAAAAEAFASNPSVFDDTEFGALADLLAPYAARDEKIRGTLLKAAESVPRAGQRNAILRMVLPKVKAEAVIEPLVRLFKKERDAEIRETLFDLVKPLSVARHPELVELFAAELVEPSSAFRLACAGILSAAAELHDAIPPALEDVLSNDSDRELLRTCLDGYLKPKVEKSFEVLLGLVRNEGVDTGSRQRCLDEILKLEISDGQRGELAEALSGLKPNTLRTPK